MVGRPSRSALVLDDYGFNHDVSRRLFPMSDVILRADLRNLAGGQVLCQARVSQALWQLQWDVAAVRVRLYRNGQPRAEARLTGPRAARRATLEFGYLDRQLVVAIDGHEVIRLDDPAAESATPMAQRALTELGIGVWPARLRVSRLCVRRDVHYVSVESFASEPLPDDAYFVLGDNSPRSRDSRQFGPIRREAIRGEVLLAEPSRSQGDSR